MMDRKNGILFFLFLSLSVMATSITIRNAVITDYHSIIALDHKITYEYFKPLYQEYFAHLELGKNPDPFLEKELAADEHDFKELLTGDNDRMLIALDDGKIVGMMLFHEENKILDLDLLLIDKEYRKQGIGKKLVRALLDANSNASKCIVYCIRGNEPARQFYEKMGFINHGLPQTDKKNIYGISFADFYWEYELII